MRHSLYAFLLLVFLSYLSVASGEEPLSQNVSGKPPSQKVEKLLREINLLVKEELSVCGEINAVLKRSLAVSMGRVNITRNRVSELEKDVDEYGKALELSRELVEGKEKENRSLRRRIAGQKYKTWAVSAASGAVILLLLL